MIKCNKNKNDNEKSDTQIIHKYAKDVDIEVNIQNITCLGKTMSICNKQDLSQI